MAKTNGYAAEDRYSRSFPWVGIIVTVSIVAIVVAFILYARSETHKHTIQCNPLGTDIIGMNLETVKKVCGEPWSEHYEGIGRYLVKITLHYSGGDIYVTAHGANLVGDQVTGWSK